MWLVVGSSWDIVTNLLEENGLSETLLLRNDRVNKSQSLSSYVVFADVKKYNELDFDEQA